MTEHRLAAFGNQLIEVHIWLREQLDALRDNVDDYLDGVADRPRDLRVHCLAFCDALHRHHTGEDATAFPLLEREFPELAPVLTQLRADHRIVESTLAGVQHLVGQLDADTEPGAAQRIRAQLDGLAAQLESHLTYEERRIVAALNQLRVPGWTDTPPAFLRTDTSDR